MPAKKKKLHPEAVDPYATEEQFSALDHKLEMLGLQLEQLRNDRDQARGELAAAFERIERLERTPQYTPPILAEPAS
jgi:chromosome segregation ATPase